MGSEIQRGGGGEKEVGEEEDEVVEEEEEAVTVKPPTPPPETNCFFREPMSGQPRCDAAPDHDGTDFHRMLPELWHPRDFRLSSPGYLGER